MPHTHPCLTFRVAGARLALRARHVAEVLPLMALERVPEAPRLIAGFLPVNDKVAPVIHLDRLLTLEPGSPPWDPQASLSHRILMIKTPDGPLGWFISEEAGVERFDLAKIIRLPVGHVLNSYAQWVIPRRPPEPSIVLLEPSRLLLEKERRFIEQLRGRAEERLAALELE
ncbi:MAG TPA: chemotaxis protein CheW [Chthoniobacteraceae bacterium]|nr:chemotaxis protein CheW [Chthoniobacteraceae bacterium]